MYIRNSYTLNNAVDAEDCLKRTPTGRALFEAAQIAAYEHCVKSPLIANCESKFMWDDELYRQTMRELLKSPIIGLDVHSTSFKGVILPLTSKVLERVDFTVFFATPNKLYWEINQLYYDFICHAYCVEFYLRILGANDTNEEYSNEAYVDDGFSGDDDYYYEDYDEEYYSDDID